MSDMNDIINIYRIMNDRLQSEQSVNGEYISPLYIDYNQGILRDFARVSLALNFPRLGSYFHEQAKKYCSPTASFIITHPRIGNEEVIQHKGHFHHIFSNGNSYPRPGRERKIEHITRDPNEVLRRLMQYKVA